MSNWFRDLFLTVLMVSLISGQTAWATGPGTVSTARDAAIAALEKTKEGKEFAEDLQKGVIWTKAQMATLPEDIRDVANEVVGATADEITDQGAGLVNKGFNALGSLSSEGSTLGRIATSIEGRAEFFIGDGSTTVLDLSKTALTQVAEHPQYLEAAGEMTMNIAAGAAGGYLASKQKEYFFKGIAQDAEKMDEFGAQYCAQNDCAHQDRGFTMANGVSSFFSGNLKPVEYNEISTSQGISQITGMQNAGYNTGTQMVNTLKSPYEGLPEGQYGKVNVAFPNQTDSLDPKTGIEEDHFKDGTIAFDTPTGVYAHSDSIQGAQPIYSFNRYSPSGALTSGYASHAFGTASQCYDGQDGGMTCTVEGQTDGKGGPVQVNFDEKMAYDLKHGAGSFDAQQANPNVTVTADGSNPKIEPEAIPMTATIEQIPTEELPLVERNFTPTTDGSIGIGGTPATADTSGAPTSPPPIDSALAGAPGGPEIGSEAEASAALPAAAPADVPVQKIDSSLISSSGNTNASCQGMPDQLQQLCESKTVTRVKDCIAYRWAQSGGIPNASMFDCNATADKLSSIQQMAQEASKVALEAVKVGQAKAMENLTAKGDTATNDDGKSAASNSATATQKAEMGKGVMDTGFTAFSALEAKKASSAAVNPDLTAATTKTGYGVLIPDPNTGMVTFPKTLPSKFAQQAAIEAMGGASAWPPPPMPPAQATTIISNAMQLATKAQDQQKARAVQAGQVVAQQGAHAAQDMKDAGQAQKIANEQKTEINQDHKDIGPAPASEGEGDSAPPPLPGDTDSGIQSG